MGAPVAYFEIISADPTRAQAFYATLFGWTLADGGSPDYRLVDTGAGDDAIGGGIGPSLPESPAGTKVYVRVDDLQAYLARAVELGGAVLMPPAPLPGDFGSFAVIADPDGQPVGLWA